VPGINTRAPWGIIPRMVSYGFIYK
jgi:hypothetical protein